MFATVVVGTDGSRRADRAVREAVDLAKSEGSRLHIVVACSERPIHTEPVQSSARVERVDLRRLAEQVAERAAGHAEEQGVKANYEVRMGDPADVLIDAAESEGADAIVVGNKGVTGAKRFFLGSVPNKVSQHAPCSVIIVRTD